MVISVEEKVISITLWGDGIQKEKWLNWYQDIENIMKSLGYKPTHIGIQSKSFCGGKILTIKRKKKDIFDTIDTGENPSSFSCYSLPKDYRTASFDYDFLGVRKEGYISIIVKEVDYNKLNVKRVIYQLNEYINYQYGEIYMMSKGEMPLIYAATRNKDNIKSFSLIEEI